MEVERMKKDSGFTLPIDSELEKTSQSNRLALNYVVAGDFHSLRQFYEKSKDADLINLEMLICCTWVDPDDPLYDVVIGTGSILIAAVMLGRYLCVRELLQLSPNRDIVFAHSTTKTSPYESLNGLTALQIAKAHMKLDIVDVLSNLKLEFDKQSEYELLQEKMVELKRQYDVVVEKYTTHEQDIKEMMRFVKGESKRKGYARRL